MINKPRGHRIAAPARKSIANLLARSLAVASVIAFAVSCSRGDQPQRLVLGTTHTLEDSGLLDVLTRAYAADLGDRYPLSMVVAGSGEILMLARRGDVDVVLSHSPDAEIAFMEDGRGESRRPVMHNDFVLLGPPSDPAGVATATSAPDAVRGIAATRQPFISRGDDSGTHMKERAVWEAAGITPDWDTYVEAGTGMAEALRLADQRNAYLLGDRATFEMLSDGLGLVILHEGDPMLKNQYSVIVVNDARNVDGARVFADWVLSEDVQRMIGAYSRGEGQRPLFVPDALLDAADASPTPAAGN